MKTLFKNARILLTDEKKHGRERFTILEGDLLTEGSYIKTIGGDITEAADKVIDCKSKLLMPGLINAHTHAYMTLFRNAADDIPFDEWLFKRIDPMEGRMEPEDAYWGSMLAALEMIRTGTTSYIDMHMHIHQNARAVVDSGLRAVLTRGIVGSETDPACYDRLTQAREEIEAFKGEERLSFMLAPHTPFTCEESFMKLLAEEAEKLDVGINIHIAESEGEIAIIKDKYGVTPTELVERTGLFDRHTVAPHCVRLTESDMDILKKWDVSVVTNPASNMKLGNGFARLPELLDKGISIAIGTDGAGSNNSLNMFREMSLAALIHKGTHDNAVAISASDTLTFATMGGAKAMGLEKTLGKLEEGRKADIIVIDLNKPSLHPVHDYVSAFSYSVTGGEVCTVMVDGKLLMEDNRLLTLDEERIYYEVDKRAGRLVRG